MPACRSCSAPIEWAETKHGKSMPLDVPPSPLGNMVFVAGKTWMATDDDRRLMRPLYTSHFATCPEADSFRRR